MKNFQNFITIFAICLIIGVFCAFSNVEKVESGAGENVSGWAWSDNIGWICFNSTTDGSAHNYGVNIDNATGEFSGHAWSDSVGWISFNRAETGVPPVAPYNGAETYIAKLINTNEISGWAKVLSSDSWIRLSDKSNGYTGDDVYIDLGNGNFHNYAWSDDYGWISFNCETGGPGGANVCASTGNYKVTTTFSFAKPITLEIEANGSSGPITIAHNASATLTWTSKNADDCVASGHWSGLKSVAPGWHSESTGNLTGAGGPLTYTYTIKCSNAVYDNTDSVDVIVNPPLVSVDIQANGSDGPLTIAHNASATLTWTSANADSCVASGSWSGARALENIAGESTGNLTWPQTYTYTIKCENSVYDDTDFVNIIVSAPSGTVIIDANPVDIGYDESTTLSWGSSNITPWTCRSSCAPLGCEPDPLNLWTDPNKSDSGSQDTANLIGPDIYTYTIECDDLIGGTVSDSVDVNVGFGFPLPEWWEISPSF